MNRHGQAMVLGIFFLLPITVMAAMVFNVSLLIGHRQELQNAADRAAGSGAVLQADLVEAIAWTNLVLADLYAQAMPHVVSTAISGTLAEIEDWGLNGLTIEHPIETSLWETELGIPKSLPPPPGAIGGAGAIERYQEFYDSSGKHLEEYDFWRVRIEAMQANLAALSQQLIKREVFRTASVNFEAEENNLDDENPLPINSLVKVNLFPYEAQYFPGNSQNESWLITQLTGGGWRLEEIQGTYLNFSITESGAYQFNTSVGEILGDTIITYSENLGVTIYNGADLEFLLEWNPDGEYWLVNKEFSISIGDHGGIHVVTSEGEEEIRRDPITGTLQRWLKESEMWEDAPIDFNIGDGIDVPSKSNQIVIGGLLLNLSNSSSLIIPVGGIAGLDLHLNPLTQKIWLSGSLTPQTELELHVGGKLNLNGWDVPQDATGQWKLADTWRDRLSEEGPSQWVYEISSLQSYLSFDTNFHRFGIDQAQGIFGSFFGTEGLLSSWLYDSREEESGWYDAAQGNIASTFLDSNQHYHRTVSCWHPLDIECPVHGTSCPGEPGLTDEFTSSIDGGWHYLTEFATEPEWVTCYLCDRVDHNSNGTSDVRRYVENNMNIPGNSIKNSRLRNPNDPPHWEITLPRRLVLAKDFFSLGINVATHNSVDPWERFILKPFFKKLNWSPIATASARIGFIDPETSELIFRFENLDERNEWIENSPWNLLTVEWIAMLVSTKKQIRLEDFELENTWLTNFPENDSGAISLLRHFLETDSNHPSQWRHRWDSPNPSHQVNDALKGENSYGQNWNYSDKELERWIKH